MRLELDYVAAPKRARALGIAVLGVAIALSVLILERYRNVRLEIAGLEAAEAMLPTEHKAPVRKSIDAELKSAQAVMRQLALPWKDMVGAVEGAARPEISLLSMQPDAQQGSLRLTAEAPGEKAMLAYLERLAASPALEEVYIASHQVMLEDPRRPLQFTVAARLRSLR